MFLSFFKECPHPDDKQRKELSRELGLEPLQVKFWFQNKRTQMKVRLLCSMHYRRCIRFSKIICCLFQPFGFVSLLILDVSLFQERELGYVSNQTLSPSQAQHERHENSNLRAENEKLRAENIRYKEALSNATCPHCGGPASIGEMSFDEQHLRIENARLRDEVMERDNVLMFISV